MNKKNNRKRAFFYNNNIVSLPRALSKLGYCSRKQAIELILKGNVKVNDIICKNIHKRINLNLDRLSVDKDSLEKQNLIYIALNKPRGLVTTRRDEKGRATVYECLRDFNLPYVFPVGRLDKASEGLLFFTNDTQWANYILNPENKIAKLYLVKIKTVCDEEILHRIRSGVKSKEGIILNVNACEMLKANKKSSWLKITLTEGKNRHIRKIFETLNIEVERLIRISIGSVSLGNLKKGEFRYLSDNEINSFYKTTTQKN